MRDVVQYFSGKTDSSATNREIIRWTEARDEEGYRVVQMESHTEEAQGSVHVTVVIWMRRPWFWWIRKRRED